MAKTNILHLSDLHFGSEGKINKSAYANRVNVLDDLLNFLKEKLDKNLVPDVVVVSGDIGWSGKEQDYMCAENWICKLLNVFDLTPNDLVTCPGNHDIDRDKANFTVIPQNEDEADNYLSIDNYSNFRIHFKEYENFCERMGMPLLQFSDEHNYLVGKTEIKNIKFVILNSAWFYRKNNEKNLWIGLPQLKVMRSKNQLKIDDKLVIAVLHHPTDFLHYKENHPTDNRVCTYQYLSKYTDVILSGHTHDPVPTESDVKYGKTPLIIAGATYSGDDYHNNFSILSIDKCTEEIVRHCFSYSPNKGEWIEDEKFTICNKKIASDIHKVSETIDKNKIYSKDTFELILLFENELKNHFKMNLDNIIITDKVREFANNRSLENGGRELIYSHEIVEWLSIKEMANILYELEYFELKKYVTKTDLNNLNVIRNKYDKNTVIREADKEMLIRILSKIPNMNFSQQIMYPDVVVQYPVSENQDPIIGRSLEIKEIKKLLKSPYPVSLIGIGGIGKTAIVQRLINSYKFGFYRPFEKIYFMSFKDTYFHNGLTKSLKKDIENYDDLILSLADKMNIGIEINEAIDITEEKVIGELFKNRTLLIIDNLETEYLKSNEKKFLTLASKFSEAYDTDSRLLITSRKGLSEVSKPYLVKPLKKDSCIKLLKSKLIKSPDKFNNVEDSDWKWIDKYADGNPALLITLSITVDNSHKSLRELRNSFVINNDVDTKLLKSKRENFFNFCFTNTLERFNESTQHIIAVISYFSSTLKIYEINYELLDYFDSELRLNDDIELNSDELINIGFIKRGETSLFSINPLFVEFISNSKDSKIYNFSRLRKFANFYELDNLIFKVRKEKNFRELDMNRLLCLSYCEKYKSSKNYDYLEKAFQCNHNIKVLCEIVENIKFVDLINRIDGISETYFNVSINEQNRFALKYVVRLKKLYKELDNELFHSKGDHIYGGIDKMSIDSSINLLKTKMNIFKANSLDKALRQQLCNLYMNMGMEENALQYITNDIPMADTVIQLYSRIISKISKHETKKFEDYKNKCFNLKKSNEIKPNTECFFRKNVGIWYYKNKDYDSALIYFGEMINSYYKINNPNNATYIDYLYTMAYLISIRKKKYWDYKSVQERLNTELKSKKFSDLSRTDYIIDKIKSIMN